MERLTLWLWHFSDDERFVGEVWLRNIMVHDDAQDSGVDANASRIQHSYLCSIPYF